MISGFAVFTHLKKHVIPYYKYNNKILRAISTVQVKTAYEVVPCQNTSIIAIVGAIL